LHALIFPDMSQYWYRNGLCHFDTDLHAVIKSDGTQEWFINGKNQKLTVYQLFDYKINIKRQKK